MGNGFTFPLQTVIFACAIRAVYQLMGFDSYCPRTQFGVFGDDLIVRKEAYAFLVRALTKLGFKVNDSKSFNTGSFRESCGHDWYAGTFVRGVYIRSLETPQHVYSACNRLNRWSAVSGVPLRNTIALLRGSLERELLVPFSEAVDCGYQVPFKLTKPKVTNAYWFSYRKLKKFAKRRKVPESLDESIKLAYTRYNEYGWATMFLGGFARRGDWNLNSDALPLEGGCCSAPPDAFMTLRDTNGSSRYTVVRSSIPFWDWLGPEQTSTRIVRGYKNDPYIDYARALLRFDAWESIVSSYS
jgi:hypothetical protein